MTRREQPVKVLVVARYARNAIGGQAKFATAELVQRSDSH